MTAGYVPTSPLNDLYANTTADTPASPTIMDAAIAALAATINSNYDFAAGLISAGTLSRLGIINVMDYGASGSDTTTTGNLASGSQVLVVTSTDTFEVGHGVSVAGAGEAGADLVTSITSIVGTNVFLADQASTTVSGATVSHDDTAAIQAAIDAISLTGGGFIFIPTGLYLLTDSPAGQYCLDIPSNVCIMGAGREFTTLKLADNQPQWTRMISINAREHVQIINLGLDGNRDNNLSGNEHMHCIFVYDSNDVKVLNCKTNNAVGDGISLSGSAITSMEIEIDGNYIENNKRNGITVEQVQRLKITNNVVIQTDGGASALDFEPFAPVTLSDAYIEGNTFTHPNATFIVSLSGYSATNPYQNIRFIGNKVTGIAGSKINIIYVENVILSNNQLDMGALICNSYSKNVSVDGNTMNLSSTVGIDIYSSLGTSPKGYRIENNYITIPNGQSIRIRGVDGLIVKGNQIIGGGASYAVGMDTSETDTLNLIVSGNYVYNFSKAIRLLPYLTYRLRGCVIEGNIFDTISTTVLDMYNLAETVFDLSIGVNQVRNSPSAAQLSLYTTLVYTMSGINNLGVTVGNGSPEGAITGSVGSMYLRRNGGAGTTLYIKESGTGNTGWVPAVVGHLTNIAATPVYVGQEALVAGVWYKAIGTTAPTDWKALN